MTKDKTAKTAAHYAPAYWEGKGEMQDVYDALQDGLVPFSGAAPTTHGNALRCLSNIYHEVFNNGGCNALASTYCTTRGRVLAAHYRDYVQTVVDFANLTDSEARTLRNALRYGNEMCDGSRPVSCKRLDAIVTKVVKAVLMAHLATLVRPGSDRD